MEISVISVGQLPTLMANPVTVHGEKLKQFREDLYAEGILHDGDTIGTDDGTLLYVYNSRSTHLKLISSNIILDGFYERADSTWCNPRKCLKTARNGARP